jgi:hypothetical protein
MVVARDHRTKRIYLDIFGANEISQFLFWRSHDSVVDVATGYGLDDQGVGVRVPVGARIFTSPCRPDRLWSPPNILYNGYRSSLLGVKRQGREADNSPPTSAEIKKIHSAIRLRAVVIN